MLVINYHVSESRLKADWEGCYMEFLQQFRLLQPDEELVFNIRTSGDHPLVTQMVKLLLLNHKGNVIVQVKEYAFGCGWEWLSIAKTRRLGPLAFFEGMLLREGLPSEFTWEDLPPEPVKDEEQEDDEFLKKMVENPKLDPTAVLSSMFSQMKTAMEPVR